MAGNVALFPQRHRQHPQQRLTPEQLGLWPLKARRLYPPNESNGTHYCGEVVADNGFRYFVKSKNAGMLVPFSEAFGYELCRSLSIATPAYDRIDLSSVGTDAIAFGSRQEAASDDGFKLADMLATSVDIHYTAALQLSRLVVVDSFLSTVDRSYRNLRWLESSQTDSRPPIEQRGAAGAVIALDFSRSFAALEWPLPPVGFPPGSPSRRHYSSLARNKFLDARVLGETIDRVANLPSIFMEMTISKCDPSWLCQQDVDELLSWWKSPLRVVRVEETEKFLRHDLNVPILHS